MTDDDEFGTRYKVVVNDEEQYSIWFADRQSPAGWRDTGVAGSRTDCLSWVEANWTDMRPLSLRSAAGH
ncbi:MbtH family protein [Saccharothrix sp. ST-888]|uniref:MbtH family protein n=1 Tax=Saccharothrix sp. ST-888 TaxID=1427391 RepID=UPI0005EC0E66|nr:MbtH family NRPS accessory protein [Saccharothrix sp. ST-888]KJK58062.1 antibiotic synthesis protein MbtH [Saccharothrix sp. ST-888]